MERTFGETVAEALELEQEWLEAVAKGEYEDTFQAFCREKGKEFLAQYVFLV
jgi:predicted RNase H-like HicB family nuclease